MTYWEALAASCVRGLAIMLVGTGVARILAAWMLSSSPGMRRFKAVCLAAMFLTPNLMVGFGYRTISVNLLNQRWLNELLYFALILFETVPAAVWLLMHAPAPSLSAEAWHCARLAAAVPGSPMGTLPRRLQLWLRGSGEVLAGPASLLFVLTFQEAELAALMQTAGWPERLFTDHIKGLPPLETARLVAIPVLIQLAFAWPLLRGLQTAVATLALSNLADKQRLAFASRMPPALLAAVGWTWTLAAIGFVVAEPAWHLAAGVWRVGRTVALQPRWTRELWDGVLLAGTCSAAAWIAAVALKKGWHALTSGREWQTLSNSPPHLAPQQRPWQGAPRRFLNTLVAASMIPGLMGTLALGFVTAGFFQRFLPGLAYTPLPLILAECLWLWPRVILVRESIAARTRIAEHQLTLLGQSNIAVQQQRGQALWWQIIGTPLAGGLGLIAWWSYLEVMLPTILKMPGFDPATQVMYNHLHYGQLAALGVKLGLILVIPGTIGLGIWATLYLFRGRRAT